MLIIFDSRIGNAFIEYFDHLSLEIYVIFICIIIIVVKNTHY